MGNQGKERGYRKESGIIVVALLAAICTYVLLIGMEKSALQNYEKEIIWVAEKSIEKSVTISKEMELVHFKQIEMDKNVIPNTAIKSLEEIEGMRTTLKIQPGMVLCHAMFTSDKDLLDGMKKPIIVGWKATDLYQAANGILRDGNRVDIYSIDKESGKAKCLWKEILVYQVFDNTGNRIASEDTERMAVRINIVLEEKEVAAFYKELEENELMMVLEL